MKILVISTLFALVGCTGLTVQERYNPISEVHKEKALNTITVQYKDKDLLNMRGLTHRDPVYHKELHRQEYFINFNF